MLFSAIIPQALLTNPIIQYTCTSPLLLPLANCKLSLHKKLLPANVSSPTTNGSFTASLNNSGASIERIRHVSQTLSGDEPEEEEDTRVSSAEAVAAAIRKVSRSPVEFVQKLEKDPKSKLVLPSTDFQKLCVEQLDLFRRIVDPNAFLSVYVRPAGSYVMDRLELRRVCTYPEVDEAGIVILIGNFGMPTGLRTAETAISNSQVEVVMEHRAVVFPMVKHPFVVGFLVAELPMLETEVAFQSPSPEEPHSFTPKFDLNSWEFQTHKDEKKCMSTTFTVEQKLNAFNISRSLATAYVMDQKAMLLQQSSWQNNVRMSNLVEQIRGPLSSIRTLSKMLSVQTKRSEISHDIAEDILVQGDRMRDTLQELQDAVYLTKVNIVRYNEETLTKMQVSPDPYPDSSSSQFSNSSSVNGSSNKLQSNCNPLSLSVEAKDLEMPMPPLLLAPLRHHGIRPCKVSDVLDNLVEAVIPLAAKQCRKIEFAQLSKCLQVAVEELDLHQAFSNLIEGALLRTQIEGKVEILLTEAPAGGALVIIDDDGPDMHYMTHMHFLIPFGAQLSSENRVEDNMTLNFVAGLTVAREILESYGCVVRVISPRFTDAALGTGGTRIELWLLSLSCLHQTASHNSHKPSVIR